jgi:hypothetical protein
MLLPPGSVTLAPALAFLAPVAPVAFVERVTFFPPGRVRRSVGDPDAETIFFPLGKVTRVLPCELPGLTAATGNGLAACRRFGGRKLACPGLLA